jgi:glycosyltransferase involved in cell wall biosynthesis
MSSDRVLLVADAPGQILDRLAGAWREAWSGQRHDIVYSSEQHAWALRRAADRSALVHWVDPLAFAFAPDASSVPQVVMAHHLTPPEVVPMVAALRSADAITTSSRRWQKKLGELTGRDIWLVPYTLDTRRFVPRTDAAELRRRFGISDSEFVIGFSARANANAFGRKGIDLLLATVAEARTVWNDLVLMLIGSGWETLSREVEQTGVRAVHLVPGTTEETAVMYPAMNVFFCTSREEGGPCTILEAMACGIPIVTTDVGHVPEVVTDGVTGFIAGEQSAKEYIDAVRALRGDPALHARVIAEARTFVEMERDHARVLPGIDYAGIYRQAKNTFAARPRAHARRTAQRAMLAGRYAARTLRDRVRGR